MKTYAEIILDNLRARGWSVGTFSFIDREDRMMHSADAHRDDGKRYIAQAESLAVALLELERMMREAENDRS